MVALPVVCKGIVPYTELAVQAVLAALAARTSAAQHRELAVHMDARMAGCTAAHTAIDCTAAARTLAGTDHIAVVHIVADHTAEPRTAVVLLRRTACMECTGPTVQLDLTVIQRLVARTDCTIAA